MTLFVLVQQKCFQEKKDILFALDGSMNLNTDTFNQAKSLVAEICAELDIAPSLIHVGMLQYSDLLNTRIEFGLNQYTKYYQVNQSLENVFHSKGRRSDLDSALTIIDEQVRAVLILNDPTNDPKFPLHNKSRKRAKYLAVSLGKQD